MTNILKKQYRARWSFRLKNNDVNSGDNVINFSSHLDYIAVDFAVVLRAVRIPGGNYHWFRYHLTSHSGFVLPLIPLLDPGRSGDRILNSRSGDRILNSGLGILSPYLGYRVRYPVPGSPRSGDTRSPDLINLKEASLIGRFLPAGCSRLFWNQSLFQNFQSSFEYTLENPGKPRIEKENRPNQCEYKVSRQDFILLVIS